MAKQLKDNHIQKMKTGRVKYLDEQTGLICKIADDILIYADKYTFELRLGAERSYHPYIINVFEDIANYLLKKEMVASDAKDIETLYKKQVAIESWINELVRPLFHLQIKTNHNTSDAK